MRKAAVRIGATTIERCRMRPVAIRTPRCGRCASKTYQLFRHERICEPLESSRKRPLDVLDLGAGNCWLSHRLSLRGHRPVAVDIFGDERDGLRAARHYPNRFPAIEADFDHLPLPAETFDLAIFNASFHYSTDYVRTLSEVRRCLRPSGSFVILDTPIYRLREHGARMVEEKHAAFLKALRLPVGCVAEHRIPGCPGFARR